MVVSKVGGVTDYASEEDVVFLTAKDGQHAADQLVWCVTNYAECMARAEHARTRTVPQFAWPIVAAHVADLVRAG
jgi:hypothetical protein